MQRVIATLVFLIGLLTASATHAAGFPVNVAHAFGETTIPAEPKRVVSIGYVEQDFLYALGIAPVGVRAWWLRHMALGRGRAPRRPRRAGRHAR